MGYILVIVLLAAAAAAVGLLKKRWPKQGSGDGPWPLFPKRVLSNPDQVLYQRLVRAFPGHVVLAQVALPAFLGVRKGRNFRAWFNRFNRLYADFVVCERDFRVVAVLELDDWSHDHPRRQYADGRKAAALAWAGIPLHRLNVNPLPNADELAQLLQE